MWCTCYDDEEEKDDDDDDDDEEEEEEEEVCFSKEIKVTRCFALKTLIFLIVSIRPTLLSWKWRCFGASKFDWNHQELREHMGGTKLYPSTWQGESLQAKNMEKGQT